MTYVWFDALLNYLVATGWQDPTENRKNPERRRRQQWGQSRHLITKDILRTHRRVLPTMLMALGVPVFRELNVHGYWLVGESKMSKSLGNVIRPLEFSEKYGGETLRFYLLKEMSFGLDATFTVEAFIQSSNAHLANGIGNLCSRVLTLCHKGFMGKVPARLDELDVKLLARRATTVQAWDQSMADLKFQNALKAWCELVTACDLYVNETKPWALAKAMAAGDEVATARLQQVLGTCCGSSIACRHRISRDPKGFAANIESFGRGGSYIQRAGSHPRSRSLSKTTSTSPWHLKCPTSLPAWTPRSFSGDCVKSNYGHPK